MISVAKDDVLTVQIVQSGGADASLALTSAGAGTPVSAEITIARIV